jgi:hypothetical protein
MPRQPDPPRRPGLTILDALADGQLFAALFRPAASWAVWRVSLAALFGLAMSEDELALYQRHTGRQRPPDGPAREAWVIAGRRGGKSRIAATVAIYLAAFRDYRSILAAGEKGTVMLLAADRRQARTLMRYVVGMLDAVPMLGAMVMNRTAESVELSNRVVIEVHTASFRAVRGYTVVAAICDEIAFWRSEDSANPDVEIINAIRPAMATVPGALLLCISSPYARRGALWDAYREHFGQDGDPVLVWQAATQVMNHAIPDQVVAEAYEKDAVAAAAEYGAEFRRDIESYIDPETLTRLVPSGLRERGPLLAYRYAAFCDPAGGSGGDSMTLAIAHFDPDRDTAVLDLVAERRPPFSPETVAEDFAAIIKRYNLRTVTGDRYAGDWPRAAFRQHGISYVTDWRDPKSPDKLVSLTKVDIYRELLPRLNAERVALLDHDRLLRQLVSLERRTGSTGRDVIDHGPNQHDDLANAAAGALLLTARHRAAPMARAVLDGRVTLVGEPSGIGFVGAVRGSQVPRPGSVGGQARWIQRQRWF